MLCRDAPVWHTATLAVRMIRIRITMKEIGNNIMPRKRKLYFVKALQKMSEKILLDQTKLRTHGRYSEDIQRL